MAVTEEKTEAKKGAKSLQDVYVGYQEKAKKNVEGVHKVDLTKLFNVEFTADFRGIKKGHKMTGISQVMRDLYVANGVVKEFKDETTDSEE